MTNAEGPRIPCSVSARQAEPPAPQMGSCTSFHEAEICCNQPEMSTDRCLTATCDLCGNGKYGGLADIYQSTEHGARPTRNQRARSTASLLQCCAEALE